MFSIPGLRRHWRSWQDRWQQTAAVTAPSLRRRQRAALLLTLATGALLALTLVVLSWSAVALLSGASHLSAAPLITVVGATLLCSIAVAALNGAISPEWSRQAFPLGCGFALGAMLPASTPLYEFNPQFTRLLLIAAALLSYCSYSFWQQYRREGLARNRQAALVLAALVATALLMEAVFLVVRPCGSDVPPLLNSNSIQVLILKGGCSAAQRRWGAGADVALNVLRGVGLLALLWVGQTPRRSTAAMYAPAVGAFLEQPDVRALLDAGAAVRIQPTFAESAAPLPAALAALIADKLGARWPPADPLLAPALALSVSALRWERVPVPHSGVHVFAQPHVTVTISGPEAAGYLVITTSYIV